MNEPIPTLPPTTLVPEEVAAHFAGYNDKKLKRENRFEWLAHKGWLQDHELIPDDRPKPKVIVNPTWTDNPAIGNTDGAKKSHFTGKLTGADKPARPKSRLLTGCIADVEPEMVDWLWHGRIPYCGVSIIGGDPGAGKSTLSGLITSTVSAGGSWPDCPEETVEPGSVIIFTAEESPSTAIRPRLDRLGADTSKVHYVKSMEREDGSLTPFSLTRDVPALEERLAEIGDVKLIIIDPIGSYIGGADSHNDAEVRNALLPLQVLAERHKIAVVLIMHLTKGSSNRVLYRMSGSIGFTGVCRMVWFLSEHPYEPSRRVLSFVKGNLDEQRTTGLSFGYPKGRMVWDDEPIPWSADEVARALESQREKLRAKPLRGPAPVESAKAADFLIELLMCRPCLQAEAIRQGVELGFKESTLRVTSKSLQKAGKVKCYKSETDRKTWLRMATEEEWAAANSAPEEAAPEPTQ